MATSKEQQGSEEVYSNEDRKLIISLLNEYSEKLLRVCDQIDKHEKRLRLFTLLVLGLIPLVLIAYFITSRVSSLDPGTALSLGITIVAPIPLFLFFINAIYDNNKRVILLKRDAKTLSAKLEKLIRIVSQAQEHVLSNFVSRVELDLRLADAESALDHFVSLIERRK